MPTPPSSALAYESLLAELLAIPDEQLAGVQLDVTAAITAVARLLSTLRGLGPTLEAAWNGFDFAQLDRLELCTLALHHAESRFRHLPEDGLCALIRQKAATLFLQAYDDLQHAVQQLLDPPTLRRTLQNAGAPKPGTEALLVCPTFSLRAAVCPSTQAPLPHRYPSADPGYCS
jgi:hypothetical protein